MLHLNDLKMIFLIFSIGLFFLLLFSESSCDELLPDKSGPFTFNYFVKRKIPSVAFHIICLTPGSHNRGEFVFPTI